MSLPNAATANAESLADLTALQATANAKFIAEATDLINNAISRGVYAVSCTSFDPCDLSTIASYFANLGYFVTFPDSEFMQNQMNQPAQLFGQFWNQFWLMNGIPPQIQNPARMVISWLIP